jgi:hypothetical protein
VIKGELICLKDSAKILGVVIDFRLRYKQHIVRAASKGLKAALALKKLQMISLTTARQLFTTIVAPVVDYALCV